LSSGMYSSWQLQYKFTGMKVSHLSVLMSIICRSGTIWLYWPKSRWRGFSVWGRSTAQCTLCFVYKGMLKHSHRSILLCTCFL